jgi:alkylation response protein AidB-like acyl-CoA dehydrogenase
MTTLTAPIRGGDLLDAARSFGPLLADRAADHDLQGTFVTESFELLNASGYLASPVPTELGGGGATTAQVAWAQHELARFCGSTALATTMHLHVVLTNAWRWRKGMPGADRLLQRVAGERLVLASTGGGDFTIPTGEARRVEGGWSVSGRKAFVSGAPAAAVASMWALADNGEAIAFGAPLNHPSVTIVENWDAPGMRGTASHDVVLDGFFVPDDAVTGRRTPGEFAPVLAIVAAKALTVIAATYLGVASGARDAVLARTAGTNRALDPGVRRTIGLMDEHRIAATWTLDGVFTALGEDPDPTPETFATATLAKRMVVEHARAIGDLAMDVLGGRGYRRGDVVERAWRDLRAGSFHPLDSELTLRVAGDVAMGNAISLRG